MKKTKLLSLILVFLMMLSSVGVFAEEVTQEPTTPTYGLSAEAITLRDNIAAVLTDVEDAWTAFDMALYQKLPEATCDMSDSAKQTVINDCIDTAILETANASDLAKSEIVLRSLGVDSEELYTYNSNDSVSNTQALASIDYASQLHYSVPWVFLANLQGNLNLTNSQTEALLTVLEQNSANGTFGYEWEGVQYPDPDTAAAVLASLAPIYEENPRAQALCDEILSSFETMIDENGSFGSANSDAMVIIGLIAMGENPYEFCNETSGKSVVDGLLSQANGTNTAFTFWGADNFMATEQGFRALVALSLYQGDAINIYDFSDTEVSPARQQNAESATPVIPAPETAKITVTMTIKTDADLWIYNMKVEIPQGGTVYDALTEALSSTGMTAEGADKGYVKSITKDGVTLSEFDKGKNSGWIYKVNGEKPAVGLTDYVLNSNDEIVWYYTEDWTVDSSSGIIGGGGSSLGGGGFGGGGASASKPEEPEEPVTEPEEEITETPEEPEIIPAPEFSDVENHWAKESINYVVALGIMNGVADDEFAPEDKLTRGMLVTMLYRLSGDEATGENVFSDISADAWFKDAANWASQTGITTGYGDGTFGADHEITRQQLVVMLMRYAKLKEMDTTAENADFKDNGEISDWAQSAVNWAKAKGVISGRDDGSFDPASGATRGEIAAVFMRFCENILK